MWLVLTKIRKAHVLSQNKTQGYSRKDKMPEEAGGYTVETLCKTKEEISLKQPHTIRSSYLKENEPLSCVVLTGMVKLGRKIHITLFHDNWILSTPKEIQILHQPKHSHDKDEEARIMKKNQMTILHLRALENTKDRWRIDQLK